MRIPYKRIVFPTRQAVRASQQHGAKLRLHSDRSFASTSHRKARPRNRAGADGAGSGKKAMRGACQWCRRVLKELISPCVRIEHAQASENV